MEVRFTQQKIDISVITSTIVSSASLFVRMTDRVSSQHLRKTPSTPVTPIPSIMSLVSLKGTCQQLQVITTIQMKYGISAKLKDYQVRTRSGVLSIKPCSKATPRSM